MSILPVQGIGPPPVNQPLTYVTSTNQSGIVAILAGFSLGIILLSTGVRLYAKHNSGPLRGDDFAFYMAALIALSQTALIFWLVSLGLGKSVELLNVDELRYLQKVCQSWKMVKRIRDRAGR